VGERVIEQRGLRRDAVVDDPGAGCERRAQPPHERGDRDRDGAGALVGLAARPLDAGAVRRHRTVAVAGVGRAAVERGAEVVQGEVGVAEQRERPRRAARELARVFADVDGRHAGGQHRRRRVLEADRRPRAGEQQRVGFARHAGGGVEDPGVAVEAGGRGALDRAAVLEDDGRPRDAGQRVERGDAVVVAEDLGARHDERAARPGEQLGRGANRAGIRTDGSGRDAGRRERHDRVGLHPVLGDAEEHRAGGRGRRDAERVVEIGRDRLGGLCLVRPLHELARQRADVRRGREAGGGAVQRGCLEAGEHDDGAALQVGARQVREAIGQAEVRVHVGDGRPAGRPRIAVGHRDRDRLVRGRYELDAGLVERRVQERGLGAARADEDALDAPGAQRLEDRGGRPARRRHLGRPVACRRRGHRTIASRPTTLPRRIRMTRADVAIRTSDLAMPRPNGGAPRAGPIRSCAAARSSRAGAP
jgi:hypothetical protein